MTRILFALFSLVLLFNNSTNAQSAFYTAREYMAKSDSIDFHLSYLEKYKEKYMPEADKKILADLQAFWKNPLAKGIGSYDLRDVDRMMKYVRDSVYKEEHFDRWGNPRIIKYDENSNNSPKPMKAIFGETAAAAGSSVGGFDFMTSLIDATAQFLVERVKEEFRLAFFRKFKEEISKFDELKALFPATYNLLSTEDSYFMPSLGEAWRSGFHSDFQEFPEHLLNVVQLKKYANGPHKETFRFFGLTLECIQDLRRGKSLGSIIQNMDIHYGGLNDELGRSISLLNVLAQNLRSNIPGKEWITPSEYQALGTKGLKFFAGILYQQNKDLFQKITIDIKDLRDLLDISGGSSTGPSRFDGFVTDFLNAAQNLAGNLETIKNIVKNNDKMTFADKTVETVGFLTEVIDISLGFYEKMGGTSSSSLVWMRKNGVATVDKLKGIIYAVENKQYGTALVNGLAILEPVLGRESDALKKFAFYGNVLVDLMSATSVADMKNVISHYAEPPGSYILKRTTSKTISLNAYPGLFAGYELTTSFKQGAFVTGITAPIGLAFNFGQKGPNKQMSGTFFLSVVDIGAVVSYRWTSTTQGLPGKISFEQILSPGAFYILGLPNAPVAIMAGVQMTPHLRSINAASENDMSNMVRFSLGASFDIPIFYLSKK